MHLIRDLLKNELRLAADSKAGSQKCFVLRSRALIEFMIEFMRILL